MSQEDVNRKLSCILSTDVVGYSRLMEENEASTVRYLEENKKLISRLIEEHNGRVVDSPGDNLLAEFSSAVKAVDCAVKIQKELKIKNAELIENRRMQFRIGINLGDVIEENGRLYGSGVNIAARLEGLADPGGICISRNVYDQVKTKLDFGYDYLGEHEVKNISEPVRVYRVQTGAVNAGKIIGEKKRGGISHNRTIAAFTVLIIIIAGLLSWNFYSHRSDKIEQASIDPGKVPVTSDSKETPKSIAVLPFEDISQEKDQEYFSDGLTEELINKLSHVKDLQVTARTSSFYFKGKNEDMRTIGEKLGVTYLLEGSVRKSGKQLRITAQLIKAADGYHLWSETYERELKDIFAIQDEIAKAVTTALSITLGAGTFNQPGMTRNVEAFDEDLQAVAEFTKTTPDSMLAAIDHAERAVLIDPAFGKGWIDLRDAYINSINTLPTWQTVDFSEKAVEALEHARDVAPDMPELIRITAEKLFNDGNWLGADHIYRKLIDMNGSTNARPNSDFCWMLVKAGKIIEALPFIQRAKRLDPLGSVNSLLLVIALFDLNQLDSALAENSHGQTLEGLEPFFNFMEWLIALIRGDKSSAATIIARVYNLDGEYPSAATLQIARHLAGDDKALLTEIKTILNNSNTTPNEKLMLMNFAALSGDPQLALECFRKSGSKTYEALWGPQLSDMRRLPGFKDLVREIGLVDYWRRTGNWGEFCHPVGDDDFECD